MCWKEGRRKEVMSFLCYNPYMDFYCSWNKTQGPSSPPTLSRAGSPSLEKIQLLSSLRPTEALPLLDPASTRISDRDSPLLKTFPCFLRLCSKANPPPRPALFSLCGFLFHPLASWFLRTPCCSSCWRPCFCSSLYYPLSFNTQLLPEAIPKPQTS